MQNKAPKLPFTGERLIPDVNNGTAFYYEHFERYRFACQFVKDKSVLDIGCGTGYGTQLLVTEGNASSSVGVDRDTNTIEYAKHRYSSSKVTYTVDDALVLKTIKNASIDVVICFEVLEHISNQRELINQIRRILKPTGLLVISTPNIAIYPDGNPFHEHELTVDEFKELISANFSYVRFLKQGWHFAIHISEENSSHMVKDLTKFTFSQAQYFLAVCSNNTLPTFNSSLSIIECVDRFNMTEGFKTLASKKKLVLDLLKPLLDLPGKFFRHE